MTALMTVATLGGLALALCVVWLWRAARTGRLPVLTEGRVRAHGTILAVGLWCGMAFILATPGIIARNGFPKGQDFVHFWTMGRLVSQGGAAKLYDADAYDAIVARDLPEARALRYLPVYPPQTAVMFAPFGRLPYQQAWLLWSAFSLLAYALCIWMAARSCRNLRRWPRLLALLAAAFPPMWYHVLDGQTTVVLLIAFVAVWRALEADRPFVAGLCLSLAFHKPQLGVAAGALFVLNRQWATVAGAITGIALQLAIAALAFGSGVVRDYVAVAAGLPTAGATLEPSLYEMHSLRAFFLLLSPWRPAAETAYVVSAGLFMWVLLATWRSQAPTALRVAQLLLVSALVAPHLFVYNLLVLAPALLIIEDWLHAPGHVSPLPAMHWTVYAVYALPLLGLTAAVTHLQLSVIAVAALSWQVYQRCVPDTASGAGSGAPVQSTRTTRPSAARIRRS